MTSQLNSQPHFSIIQPVNHMIHPISRIHPAPFKIDIGVSIYRRYLQHGTVGKFRTRNSLCRVGVHEAAKRRRDDAGHWRRGGEA